MESETNPLSGSRLIGVAMVLAFANFMAVLDTAVANVSLPTIAGSLGVSATQGTWVVTSYSVAEAISVPLTGWLAGRLGTVRAFIPAMVGFAVCSAMCGLSTSLSMLILFRVLQGLCGGPMIPLSQALLRSVFPKEKLGLGLGLWSMTTLVAPVMGPIIGGQLSQSAGWEWIFFINVPVAIACCLGAAALLLPMSAKGQKGPFDAVGLGLLVVWVGALQIMLDKGKDLDWFNSPVIIALAVIAFVGFGLFLIWELTDGAPIVNLRLFRHHRFTVAALTLAVTFGSFFSSVILLPLWLQTVMGYTADWSGFAVGSAGILSFIVAPLVSQRVDRWDARVLLTIGLAAMTLVSVLRAGFTTDVDFTHIAEVQIIQGIGMAFIFPVLNNMAMGALPPEDVAAGSGLLNFMRTLAGAIAVSISVTAWSDLSSAYRGDLIGKITVYDPSTRALVGQLAPGANGQQGAAAVLSRIVDQQAITLATDHQFMTSALIFTVAAVGVWLLVGRERRRGGETVHVME